MVRTKKDPKSTPLPPPPDSEDSPEEEPSPTVDPPQEIDTPPEANEAPEAEGSPEGKDPEEDSPSSPAKDSPTPDDSPEPAEPPKATAPEADAPASATASPKRKRPKARPKAKRIVALERSTYMDYVMEALQALQAEDRKYVGLVSIQNYIFRYIDEVNPKNICRCTKSAIGKLIASNVLKQKKQSVALAATARRSAKAASPGRVVVRTKAPKRTEEQSAEGGLAYMTQSGRWALQRY
jgi:hypothetical protein